MPQKVDMVFFPRVLGSMTSDDGTKFFLHVEQEGGRQIMLGFPHVELPGLIENVAVQASHGRDDDGDPTTTAFKASGFELGRGPDGAAVLTLMVGTQGRLSFLLPSTMPGQLSDLMRKFAN